jgi:hypothetical protein
MFSNKRSSAGKPPAEAPMPTTGNGKWGAAATTALWAASGMSVIRRVER